MHIEQITKEALLEISPATECIADVVEAAEFLRRCLAKLAKLDLEPTAYITYKGYLLHADDPKVLEHSNPESLFTEAQLIAAQQRTAEACAKYLQSRSNKMSASESRNKFGVQVGAASLDSAAKRIRNGEWREYL